MDMLRKPRQWLHQRETRRKNQQHLDHLDEVLATDQPILLVHQMGRAGSMTTTETLRSAGVEMPVFHAHWLNPDNVAQRLRWLKGKKESEYPLNVRVGRRLCEHLQQDGLDRRDWHIVSVFREPVARNVSVYFLSINTFLPDFFKRYAHGELRHEDILENFLQEFPHDEPLRWFDQEIRDNFGIDTYDSPFPREKGYQIIRRDNIHLLTIKVEQLNDCYQEAFGEFLGVDVPQLNQTHITDRNPAYSMYREFIEQSELPQSYLDEMYSSQFARHFYGADEIAAFRKKWGQPYSQ